MGHRLLFYLLLISLVTFSYLLLGLHYDRTITFPFILVVSLILSLGSYLSSRIIAREKCLLRKWKRKSREKKTHERSVESCIALTKIIRETTDDRTFPLSSCISKYYESF